MTELTASMLPEAAQLFTRVFNNEPWNDSWTQEQSLERLTDIFNTPHYAGAAYFENGKMIGLIMGRGEVYFDAMHFQVIEFCVDTEMQGRGIGRKMLADFSKLLKDKGVAYIHLITMRDARTEGFYAKNGFSTDEGMCHMTAKL
ncbi:MAG: GNAT family N-acetyltransferase [Clostridia bacterium]|nr:GNAT family N-acetyltransferase [Clostridia bacterium]